MSPTAAAAALLAALVGAGFASGREIESFFARYGYAGLAFALVSVLVLYTLCLSLMHACRHSRAHSLCALCALAVSPRAATACRALLHTLLCASAGAMLCAGGELCALTLPLRYAYALGVAVTLALGCLFAGRCVRALSMLGALLVPLMGLLLLFLLSLPPMRAHTVAPNPALGGGFFGALCYAPLNLVLASGVVCDLSLALDPVCARRAVRRFAAALAFLLLLSTLVLIRHRAQTRTAALPFVVLCARLGKPGFYLCASMLYLAVLSTLTALLRALYAAPFSGAKQRARRLFYTLACALCAFIGFDRLVGRAYPALGAACAFMLVAVLCAARRTGYSTSTSER